MAKLYYRYAVMGAGKSTQLLQIAYDYEKNNNRKILCLKPKTDTKAEDYIVSRLEDGTIKRKCDFLIELKESWLFDTLKAVILDSRKNGQPISIILIDESQFLSRYNIWDLARVVTHLDVPVICFGLKVDAFGNPFPGSAHLFALAQDIEAVTTRAICRLSKTPKKATMQLRCIDGEPVFEGDQVAIENEMDIIYEPICLEEYIKLYDEYMSKKQ